MEGVETKFLKAIEATSESFKGYGQIIEATADGQEFGEEDAQLDLSKGTPRFYIMHLQDRPLAFSTITHHASVTQCLGAIGGGVWYLGVSNPSIVAHKNDAAVESPCGHLYVPPKVDQVKVFRFSGPKFVKLEPGTWHAGPLFKEGFMDFYNLELSDTNVVDHTVHNFERINGVVFAIDEYVSAHRYSEALDILHSSACLQLQNGQVTCGSELAVLFVETLVKGKVPYDDDVLDRVRKIYELFPRASLPQRLADDDDMQQLAEALGAAKTHVECCMSFLKAAIKWSAQFGAPIIGSPQLHTMLADYVYSELPEEDMTRVSYHFVRGDNPKKFASTLVNFMEKCYPGEDDLAIARAVLMYLAMGNLRDANVLMDEIKPYSLNIGLVMPFKVSLI